MIVDFYIQLNSKLFLPIIYYKIYFDDAKVLI